MINFTISYFPENQLNITLSLPFCVISYVYYTQIMQAETLASAYRLWRRNWKGRGREYTAGALVWQVRELFHLHPHAPSTSRSRLFEVHFRECTKQPAKFLDNISMIMIEY